MREAEIGTRVHFIGPEPPLLVRDDFKSVQAALEAQQSVLVTRSEGATAAAIYRDAVAFIEDSPPGVVTSMNPSGGVPNDVVTITGSGFTGATAVDFGVLGPVPQMTVDSDSQITVVVPAAGGGLIVDVSVVTPGGAIPAGQFGYVN